MAEFLQSGGLIAVLLYSLHSYLCTVPEDVRERLGYALLLSHFFFLIVLVSLVLTFITKDVRDSILILSALLLVACLWAKAPLDRPFGFVAWPKVEAGAAIPLLGVGVIFLSFAYLFLQGGFFDLFDWTNGHYATLQSILNGAFPPEHLAYPSVAYNYHWGIDFLFAFFSIYLPGSPTIAIGAAATTLLLIIVSLLWRWCRTYGHGPYGIALIVAVSLFAGGLQLVGPLLEVLASGDTARVYGGDSTFMGKSINLPNNLFLHQPPFLIGFAGFLSLALTLRVAWPEESGRNGRLLFFGALGVSFAMLAFGHFPTCVMAAFYLFVDFSGRWLKAGGRREQALNDLVFVVLLSGILILISPFNIIERLPSGLAGQGSGEFALVGLAEIVSHLGWVLMSCGIFVAVPVLSLVMAREDASLAIVALVGLLIPVFIEYRSTHDIVKFMAFGVFVGCLLLPGLSANLARRYGGLFAMLSLLLVLGVGGHHGVVLHRIYLHQDFRSLAWLLEQPLNRDLAEVAIPQVKLARRAGEIVWISAEMAPDFNALSGIPSASIGRSNDALRVPPELVAQRRAFLEGEPGIEAACRLSITLFLVEKAADAPRFRFLAPAHLIGESDYFRIYQLPCA